MSIIRKPKRAGFRIYIHDLETKKARSVSLTKDHYTLDDIKQKIIECFS